MADKIRVQELSTIDLPRVQYERSSRGEDGLEISDLAGAAHKMGRVPWAVFMYVYRHDESVAVMATLRAWLLVKAVGLAFSEGWPKPVRDKPETKYLQRLAELVLLEARHPKQAGKATARAVWWGVEQEEWNSVWAVRYEALWTRFKALESTAMVHLSVRANRDIDDPDGFDATT